MGIDVEIGVAVGKSNYGVYRHKLSMPYILAGIILISIVASGFIYAFEFLYGYVMNLDIFALKEIAIYGNSQVSTSDILNAAKLHNNMGTHSIYSILPHVVEKRIKSRFRYLENVEIKRGIARDSIKGIYGLLAIKVKEREPIALVASGRDTNSFIVTDASGLALEELKGNPGLCRSYRDMPVILGVDKATLGSGILGEENPQRFPLKLALNVVINVRSVVPGLLRNSYIDAREPDDIILYLKSQDMSVINVRLASDRIREGLRDAEPVIAKLTKDRKETKYVDVRFSGAVYCMELEDNSMEGGGKFAQE